MNYKDKMGQEIKDIFQEDAKDIKLSQELTKTIMENRKISLGQRIKNFLNKEIEIPLAPALIGFVLVLGISIFPKGFASPDKTETINLNGSQIIIKSSKEVIRDEIKNKA